MTRFRVAEVFGPTIQGEGNQVGQLTHFVRFGACDYRCSWCDSMHAVLPDNVQRLPLLSVSGIIQKIQDLGSQVQWVTLSGGNPALWDLGDLISELHELKYKVAIETQGSQFKPWLVNCDNVVISPKPPSSGMDTDFGALDRLMSALGEACTTHILKVVCFTEADIRYARNIHSRYPEIEFYMSVGTVAPNNVFSKELPLDSTEVLAQRTQYLLSQVLQYPDLGNIHLLPQVHVMIWGHKQGV